MNWNTFAFTDSSKYWVQMTKVCYINIIIIMVTAIYRCRLQYTAASYVLMRQFGHKMC